MQRRKFIAGLGSMADRRKGVRPRTDAQCRAARMSAGQENVNCRESVLASFLTLKRQLTLGPGTSNPTAER